MQQVMDKPVETTTEERDANILRIAVPGAEPWVVGPEDLTSRYAWWKMLHQQSLTERDFVDPDNWRKYFYLSLGLLEGVGFIYGLEGSGKSLWASYTALKLRTLFGKQCTLDWNPPAEFGPYDYMDIEAFKEEMDNLNKLADTVDKAEAGKVSWDVANEMLQKSRIYNRTIVMDEAYLVLDKSHRTNVSKMIGRQVRQWRHYHNLWLFISPDAEDFDRRMAWNRRTHTIVCGFEAIYKETCTYRIWNRKTDMTKQMHLTPGKWAHIWRSHNIIATKQTLKVNTGV